MGAMKPAELHSLFTQAFNTGDVEALLDLYEPEAIFIPEPGQTAKGREAIREALAPFFALELPLTIETASAVETDDGLALLEAAWSACGTAADGSEVDLSGRSSEVARRQPDGRWLYIIDDPGTGKS